MNSLDASIWSKSYDLSVPLQVLLANGQSLICEEVVRAMPGRRYVCRGSYDGKPVFVKLFSNSKKAKREWQSELSGIRALKAAGIYAPEIIFSEISEKSDTHLIVYAELLAAESARQRWEQGNETARQMLIMQLIELLSQHHAAGLRQSDCHLLNFVFSEDILYTLDASDIIVSGSPLSRNDSMNGFADLLGLLDAKYDDLLPGFYKYYWQCRESETDDTEQEALMRKVIKLREYKLRKYLDKIYRNCSEFIAEKSWRKILVRRRDADNNALRELVNAPDERLSDSQYSIIKDGNTCKVSLIENSTQRFICKRYNIKNAWHALSRAFRESRASCSWRNAHRLKKLNITTPQPYALIEQRFGPIRRKAWLLMPYIDGTSGYDFFRDENKRNQQHIAVSQFVSLFNKMLQAKLSHGDMKITNFIFSEDELFVIDLDSMRQHNDDADFTKAFRKDMKRFMRNWDDLPEIAALFIEQLSPTAVAEYLPATIKG